jgi:putative pyruvate formate lyase activating enzyme
MNYHFTVLSMIFQPAYTILLQQKKLKERVSLADEMLQYCLCCGWECGVNRSDGEVGVCKTGATARISSYGAHPGEEKPLSGWRGSGTVFFTRCNLRCQFCQNADISQTDSGDDVDPSRLAVVFLQLQQFGCHNINLVSPTHVVPQIIQAVYLAAQGGLTLPIVYNTGGYDSLKALALLEGIVDIYMPDMKYANARTALRYSRVPDYPAINQAAVLEMHRQVGDLVLDEQGIARRGLLVRHLILPNGAAGTEEIVRFLAEKVSRNTYLNVMDQYHPAYRAGQYPKLNRRIRADEYNLAVQAARLAGLTRLDHIQ